MKNAVIFAIITWCSINLYAQSDYTEYYNLIGKGYTEYANKEYQNAIKTFELAFSNYYPFPDDINILKKCYLAINDREKAYDAMRRMVLCGFKLESSIPLVNSNTALENFKADTRSGDIILEQKLVQEYPSLRADYLKNIDWDSDQYLKILTHFEVHTSLMRKISSIKEEKITANYGFRVEKEMFMNLMASQKNISRINTDTWSSNEMGVVIVHTSQQTTKDDFQLYFQLLKKQVLKGNVSNFQYAICYDNIFYNNKKVSYYGQHVEFNSKTGSLKCVPVDDVKNVDKRRTEIGLPPLWVWCEIHNIELPKGYQKS